MTAWVWFWLILSINRRLRADLSDRSILDGHEASENLESKLEIIQPLKIIYFHHSIQPPSPPQKIITYLS